MTDQKYLAVSDIQFPYEDKRGVELWLKVLEGFKPDLVDIVGDIDDADSTSQWAIGPEKQISVSEAGARHTRDFLTDVKARGKRGASIHLFDGNHGWTRHRKYLMENAPQFMEHITPNTLYGHEDLGIEFHYYDDLPYNRFNDMYVHHGSSVSKHSGGSVQSDMEIWGVSIIRGHSHRLGTYYRYYELEDRLLEGYEIGHLMHPKHADYSNKRNWQQGFAYGYIDPVAGTHQIHLVPIRDYTCYVGGKKFSA